MKWTVSRVFVVFLVYVPYDVRPLRFALGEFAMRANYLVRAAKRMVVTEDQVRQVEQRLRDKERSLESEARTNVVNQKFLARTYSL